MVKHFKKNSWPKNQGIACRWIPQCGLRNSGWGGGGRSKRSCWGRSRESMDWNRLCIRGGSENGRIRQEATWQVAQSTLPRGSLISRDLRSSRWELAGECWDEKTLDAPGAGRPSCQTCPEGMWLIPPLTQTPILVAALPPHLPQSHTAAVTRPTGQERCVGTILAQRLSGGGVTDAGTAAWTAHAWPANL